MAFPGPVAIISISAPRSHPHRPALEKGISEGSFQDGVGKEGDLDPPQEKVPVNAFVVDLINEDEALENAPIHDDLYDRRQERKEP